jgi:hypothetical protein
MHAHRKMRALLLTAVTLSVVGFAAPALANFESLSQPVRGDGDITYISGGVGADEIDALKTVAKDYNLRIINANQRGHFTADTNLTITTKDGREVISADNTGPLFYAQLPPGEYTIKATSGDQQTVRNIKISAGRPINVSLIWQES